MTTALRRLPVALVLAVFMSVVASGAAHAASSPLEGSATPNPPGGTSVLGQHHARVCVQQFAPGTPIRVVNQTTGDTTTIHTNLKGHGCNDLPIGRSCSAKTQTIVETGKGLDGKSTTVTQTVTVPASAAVCTSSAGGTLPFSGSTLPFTGANILVPAVAGLLLVIIGTILARVRRRGRAGEVSS